MGAWNMFQVMDALEGADVSLKGWDDKKHAVVEGCDKIRRLDTYDLALLLTIAHRQHDEDPDQRIPPEDCLCFGGEGMMMDLTRMGKTKLEDCRAFLMATNLISYTKREKCPGYLYPIVRTKTINYVWRLNKPVLLNLIRHTLEDGETPPGDEVKPVSRTEQARVATTKSTYTHTTNRSMSPSAIEKADRRKRALVWIDYIARKYDLTPEEREKIGVEGIIVATAQKRAEDVRKAIDAFGQKDMFERKFGAWIGMLVGRLKDLPNADDPGAIPSAEELEAQFTEAKRVDATEQHKKAAQKLWKEIYNGLGLEGLPDKGKGCMQALIKCLEAHKADFDATIARIRANTPGLDGFNLLGAQEKSDAHARAEKLKGVLAELTP